MAYWAQDTPAWTTITSAVLLSLIFCQNTKLVVASEADSGIQSHQNSTTEVNGCPYMCDCVLSNANELYINDCSTDPKDDLHQVLDSHLDVVSLIIVRSHLTKLTYNLSIRSQLTNIKLTANDLETVPNELISLTLLRSLDLSVNRIGSIPFELSKLKQLTSLDLSHNIITSSTCALSDMAKLVSLNLSFNALVSFPCHLSMLIHLISLDLSSNAIHTIPCNLSPLSPLSSLNMAGNRLATFPCKLSTFTQLTLFDLSNNNIQSVVCNLSNLNNLTSIDLKGNQLSMFPCKLSTFTQLTTLDLSHNNIMSVDCDLSNLTMLTSLYLWGNKLSMFPCELATLTHLTTLDLSYNNIMSVECDLSTLTRLTSLYLWGNKLSMFPCELATLAELTTFLYLSNNNIQSVECDLSTLTRLTSLNLWGNKLSMFPCKLATLTHLTTLDLSFNEIMSVECDFSNLTLLTSLNLTGNKLSMFPCEVTTLTQLTTLDLSFNNIQSVECDFSNLTLLTSLNLMRNELSKFPCVLTTLTKLTTLDPSFNNIMSVEFDLSNLTLLTYLTLTVNKLSMFPCELTTLTQLTTLDLSGNEIMSVECDLSNLTMLTFLDLKINKLSMFPCELTTLTQLTTLDLSGNNINSVECDLSYLTMLTSLSLYLNKLSMFPCALSTLTQLTTLDLSVNHILFLECDLSNPNMLTYLQLAWNNLSVFPSGLSQGESLFLSSHQMMFVQCGVSHCTPEPVDPVQCDISNLTKLTHLDLSDNLIHVLDSWPILLAEKGTLKSLDLTGNHISQFTNYVGAPAKLCSTANQVISLQSNRIRHYMDIIEGWNLKDSTDDELTACLNFVLDQDHGNPLSCDCVDYELYKLIQNRNASHKPVKCHDPHRLKGEDPTQLPLDQFICEISTKDNCPIGCECTDSPYHQNMSISCEHFEGALLPHTVPTLSRGSFHYDINFSNGSLLELTWKYYLKKVIKANLGKNLISFISMNALLALQNISRLYLDQNKMKRLPDGITNVNLSAILDLKLGNNPWVCDCTAIETKKWMQNFEAAITDASHITCHSPPHLFNKTMLHIDDNVICPDITDQVTRYGILAVVLSAIVSLIYIIMNIKKWPTVRRMKKQMEYANVENADVDNANVNHIFVDNTDEDNADANKEFDVFVSYAREDEDYILDDFIPQLENHNIKVCFHRIHFLGGNTIIKNISDCINNSKRTLVFFSNFYKKSGFCIWEFKEALNKDVREGTTRLITVKDTDLDMADLDASTRAYFNRRTYMDKGAVRFWENLLHSLPKLHDNVGDPDLQRPANAENVELQEL